MKHPAGRFAVAAVVFSLLAAACTPANKAGDDPPSTDETTTSSTASTSSTVPPIDDEGNLVPPQRGDASVVAGAVLVPIAGFDPIDEPPQHATDLVFAMETWVPDEFVLGTASVVYDNEAGAPVAAVSVIPSLSLRGDPDLVPSLIRALTGMAPQEPFDGDIYTAFALTGIEMKLWSTGDGFVIASSPDDAASLTYLGALKEMDGPNDVWAGGTCLYLEEDEDLPYAPFPPDVVVPCDGAHNAEVLIGDKVGTDLAAYDDDAITYERDYVCDEAYTGVFGSQRTNAPSLITYMPDEAEWNRGDRYLACVVLIERNDGRELFTGAMADLADLAWQPEVSSCILGGLPADTVDCGTTHAYQYLGDVEIVADTWPDPGDDTFDQACRPLLDGLSPGPAELEVFPAGLGAYAFEQGDRTVQCMAYAVADGFLVETVGSFDDHWFIIGTGGIPA
ncbi:MAG: septum formation family protein [Actinomycetia bacterium]|nr:septum formation family protein [Actinomycetes bacterium]